ncbi:unnamed protein product [Calicophoron daubneyi]|uniref:Suppressor of fused n=1 Tax=Calicophoron daubneyi TaxID=300641 RepID=A0AAV2TXQ4_CALDB
MSHGVFEPTVGGPVASHPTPSTSHAREEQPLGLKAIYGACRALYPDQPAPLQVVALREFWMGGPDPLDFINMYSNPGSPELRSPPHWHYVTNGLSDLYGDSRLHSQCTSTDDPSGFGFELTLRVRRDPGELHPPTWPAHLLQSLARYVFRSQAQLIVGDHIPWPTALDRPPNSSSSTESPRPADQPKPVINPNEPNAQSIAMAAAATAASILAANGAKTGDPSVSSLINPSTYASMVAAALAAVSSTNSSSNLRSDGPSKNTSSKSPDQISRIHHMLLVEDPQLKRISTPYGYVQFLQIVGLCDEELRLVQRWTGTHVADLMRRLPETGGELLVTDMRRKSSLFELEPSLADCINEHLRREGSNLSGVTTQYFSWAPISLSTLADLLPGELESRRQRRLAQRHDSPLTSGHAGEISSNLKPDSTSKLEGPYVPTDLSLPRTSSTALSDSRSSPGPTAMDTDETVVSASTKKAMDDDEFVDVVGDENASAPGDRRSTVSQKLDSEKSDKAANKDMFPFRTPFHQSSRGPLESGKASEMQSTSAPGGFSAWCARTDTSASVTGSMAHRGHPKTGGSSSPTETEGSGLVGTPTIPHTLEQLTSPVEGPLGFRTFNAVEPSAACSGLLKLCDSKGTHTPGSTGEGSAPCTPLAHLSLSPASLDLLPTRIIECLDVHLCREAGEMLPLAVNDRLRHGRHFTFLNAHYPDHAITLVPNGVSGAFVSEETPYVARGPWLQILLPEDFLERLEFHFSILMYPNELHLPLVFRWPERRLRICLVDPTQTPPATLPSSCGQTSAGLTPNPLLPKAVALNSPDTCTVGRGGSAPGSGKFAFPLLSPVSPNMRKPSASGPNPHPQQQPSVGGQFSPPYNFPLFPPGCIPPPAVLATIFNAASQANPVDPRCSKQFEVNCTPSLSSTTPLPSASSTAQPPSSSHPAGANDMMANWVKFFSTFMNMGSNSSAGSGLPESFGPLQSPQSVARISELMQTAMSTVGDQLGAHHPPIDTSSMRPFTQMNIQDTLSAQFFQSNLHPTTSSGRL